MASIESVGGIRYLTLAILVVAGWSCAAADPAPSVALAFQAHQIAGPGGESVPAQIGRLRVPENRSVPSSRWIDLAVVRLPGRAGEPADPIVYLAGGPGSSAIRAASGPRLEAFEALRAAGDVVLLDQRGTGASRPNLRCPVSEGLPLDRAATRDDVVRNIRGRAAACAAYWRAREVDLAGYHALEIAADLVALRDALGARRLILWGVSYGTHLALAAVRRYPDLAARAVLAGVVGPDDSWKLPSTTDSAFAAIARSHDTIPGRQPLLDRIRHAAARLDATPAIGTVERDGRPVRVVFGGFDLRFVLAGLSGTADAAREVPRLVDEVERGAFAGVALHVLRNRRAGSIGSAMQYATLCASGASAERRRRIEAEARRSLFGDALNLAGRACDVWHGPDLGAGYREPVRSDVPTLIVSGTRDFTTPLADGARVLTGLLDGSHLVLEGARHGSDLVVGTPALLDAVLRFIRGEPIDSLRLSVPVPR